MVDRFAPTLKFVWMCRRSKLGGDLLANFVASACRVPLSVIPGNDFGGAGLVKRCAGRPKCDSATRGVH